MKRFIHSTIGACGYDLCASSGPLKYSFRRKDLFGVDHLNDIRTIIGRPLRCILDIGAHVGETAIAFADAFSGATIYSFEPDPENFAALKRNVTNIPRIKIFNAAVGRQNTKESLHRNEGSQTHSLLAVADQAEKYVVSSQALKSIGDVTVEVKSLDSFAQDFAIEPPDLLKADTQGYELEVLGGAPSMLSGAQPPLLYLEVAFVHQYRNQPLFQDVYAWVYERGYRLVGLYGRGYSTHYYQVGTDALFVHETMGARLRR